MSDARTTESDRIVINIDDFKNKAGDTRGFNSCSANKALTHRNVSNIAISKAIHYDVPNSHARVCHVCDK